MANSAHRPAHLCRCSLRDEIASPGLDRSTVGPACRHAASSFGANAGASVVSRRSARLTNTGRHCHNRTHKRLQDQRPPQGNQWPTGADPPSAPEAGKTKVSTTRRMARIQGPAERRLSPTPARAHAPRCTGSACCVRWQSTQFVPDRRLPQQPTPGPTNRPVRPKGRRRVGYLPIPGGARSRFSPSE